MVREAENLAAAGAREINLIGQDTTSYGEDLGLRDGLAQLLERLAQIEDLLWVRFLYAYPNRVTQQLLDTIAAHPRLAKYIDMPLQHASRNVLARMKRGSNGDVFLKLLERIRRPFPASRCAPLHRRLPRRNRSGFRGASAILCAPRNSIGWASSHIPTWTTPRSYALDEKVDAETITDRRNRLMATQKKISREKLAPLEGPHAPRALVEGPSKDNPLVWEARLEGMAPEIDGKLYLTDIELPSGEVAATGDVARVEITKTDDYDLVGRVVEILPRAPRARDIAMRRRVPPVPQPKSSIASPPARRCASWVR